MSRDTASYLRISQDRSSDESAAVVRQREDIDDLARLRDTPIAREYLDDKLSAKGHVLRPDFERLLVDLDTGTIGTVIAWVWDRLTRNAWDTVRLIEACRINRVRLVFVKGDDIDVTTPGGELAASVIASVARHEIAQKSERQRRQRQQEAEMGRTPAARRPFGYQARTRIDGERFAVSLVDPDEATLLVGAYRQVLDGRTMGSIARWLTDNGSTTPAGRPWTYHNLRSVMVNPRYKGVRGVRQLLPGRDGEKGKRQEFHTEIAQGQWEAIVSSDVWDAAQTILRDPGRRKNHPVNTAQYLLPFLARCGVCGAHTITGSRSYATADGVRVHDRLIRCSSLRHVCRKAEPVEAYVEEVLLARLEDPGARQAIGRRVVPSVDLDDLRARQVSLTAQLADARGKVTAGRLALDDFVVFRDEWNRELADVNAALGEVFRTDPVAEIATTTDPRAMWASWPMDTKRALVAQRLDVVVHSGKAGRPGGRRFDPDTVDVTWRD